MLLSPHSRVWSLIFLVAAACGDDEASPGGEADAGESPDSGEPSDSGEPDAGSDCDGTDKPEMTGPISGLKSSYQAGDDIDVSVPIDEDTARVTVGLYEEGSERYLGGSAADVSPGSTAQLSLYAGVEGESGTFYLSIELCSTEVCTAPFVRNTYQRADRAIPFEDDETYEATRENVGGMDLVEACPSSIAIQSFTIE